MLTFNFLFGGSSEIRTRGAFPHDGVQDRCNKPLCHTSINLAHGLGLEPRRAVLETAMLPITSSMYKIIQHILIKLVLISNKIGSKGWS